MAKYRGKTEIVEAVQWFKNGDHPGDNSEVVSNGPKPFMELIKSEGKVVRRFRHPGISGSEVCRHCKKLMHNHGWIDQKNDVFVCPGDYVVTLKDGEYAVYSPSSFAELYEKVEENKTGREYTIVSKEEWITGRPGEIKFSDTSGEIKLSQDPVALKIDELADLCELWKKHRDKGRQPEAISSSILMLANEIVFYAAQGKGKSCR